MSSTIIEFPPRREAREADRPQDVAAPDITIDEIVDAAIEASPKCVRRRVILDAIDWSAVPPAKVELLVSTLAEARVTLPARLARTLLLAGHQLPSDVEQFLSEELAVLARLNRATGEIHEEERASAMIAALAHVERAEGDVIVAIVERLVALSWDDEAVQLALAHGHRVPQALKRAAGLVEDHIKRLPDAHIHIGGTSTTHMLAEELVPAFAAVGWQANVSEGNYAQLFADLMNPPADAGAFVGLLDLDGFATHDWRKGADDNLDLVRQRAAMLADAMAAFSERSTAFLLINTLPAQAAPTAGLLDRHHAQGLHRAISLINETILESAQGSDRIVVIDADQALSGVPLCAHVDPKLWYYGRIAYSADATRALACAFAGAWNLRRCGPVKVLAVDLDDTLWGGIYGDDGVERLACGEDFPGNAFRAMQEECLRLKAQGFLLVALSKNDAAALTVFDKHPGMLLRADDFAAWAVDWEPKPENIRGIARELNLGLDSFLFLDDSPHERDAMRRLCPEVRVPEMPKDPAERPRWLRRLVCTWPVHLTPEDASRAASYTASRKAADLEARASSFGEYLEGLEQRLVIAPVGKATLMRTAQLHQRTNQFNLTTLRSTESDIRALTGDRKRGLALMGRVSDKFGDHGLVIAATVSIEGSEAVIKSFVMSCRVIGREIERAFMGELLRELKRRGVARVRGDFMRTAKNHQVRDFYASCGFAPLQTSEAASSWTFSLEESLLPQSRFVAVSQEI